MTQNKTYIISERLNTIKGDEEMTDRERNIRTISLCIAALETRDSDIMRRSLVQILEDHRELVERDPDPVSDVV